MPFEIGSIFLRAGKESLGLYWLEQALARDPEHEATHTVLADYYNDKGDKEKAAAHRRWLTGAKQRTASP